MDKREKEILKKAKKAVKDKKDFYGHLAAYIPGILFLFFINWMTSPEFWWFLFPAAGWGFGLAIHYLTVFGFMGVGDASWEKRQLAKEIYRLRRDEELLDEDEELLLKEPIKMDRDWKEDDLV